ncbi:MAG: YdeI/OmpD-associated family protein [Chloroflexi bacterium]|nr:YdeI/OmpD-associated family protein [Chloroflexota bacterium]
MPSKPTFTALSHDAGRGAFVEIPKDLMKALEQDGEARAFFEKLSPTHRKEYLTWIAEAKREETRQNRIAKTIQMLKNRRKNV